MYSLETRLILTPSEVVYLAGDRFAPARTSGLEYNPVEGKSSAAPQDLAPLAYAAAFIALEREGLLRLNVRPKKALFGLRTSEALFADPTGTHGPFPANSIESDLRKKAENLFTKQMHQVSSVVAVLIWLESKDPFALALEPIRENLCKRGLLTTTTNTHLKFIKTTEYSLPASTAALAHENASQVQRLLGAYRTESSEMWQRLVDEICAGIRRRTAEKQSALDFDLP